MNIWILTIGSSDVQLHSNGKSQDKGRKSQDYSDQIWNYWYTDDLKTEYKLPHSAKPTRTFDDKDESYRIPPKILGMVYNHSPESVQQEILTYLTFPLFDNFVAKLKDKHREKPEEYPLPEAIFFLLSDQSNSLENDRSRQKLKSPYWQDTCELERILRHYLNQEFTDTPCEVILLDPLERGKGLDNWDAVLDLVSHKFKDLDVEVSEGEYAYVSHQAGTPAISSAVQFCSLAKFGDRVRFLVSNEYDREQTGFVESSSYLRGIEIQQAKKLLENHDYSGMKDVLKKQIEEADNPKGEPKLEDEVLKHISYLLDIAIQWNFAKFEDFAKKLSSYPEQNLFKQSQAYLQDVELAQTYLQNSERAKAYLQNPDQYWWTSYEAAYLGVIRLKQKNTVEAMFHTFRAVEGLIREWAIKTYADQIKYSNHDQPNTPYFHRINLPSKLAEWFNYHEHKKFHTVALHGKPLFELLKESRPNKKIIKNPSISQILCGGILIERNTIFHQLKGLDDDQLYKVWGFNKLVDPTEWESRVLGCLNFIVDTDLPQDFKRFKIPKDASLMAQVHQELEKAIDSL